MSKEFKVGLVVLIGIILLFSSYIFYHAVTFKSQTYEIKTTFKNLEKLDTGAIVRLSGFKIGNVSEIKLTEQSYVLVKMRIDKKIHIPKDSYAMATTGAVIGEMFIKITPGDKKDYLKDGDTITGVAKVSFDDITNEIQNLLVLTNSSMEKVNSILDNKGYLINAMKNVEKVSKKVLLITDNMNSVIDDIKVISSDFAYVTSNSKDNITETIDNVKSVSDRALDISDKLDVFIEKDALPQVKSLLENADSTMVTLNETLAQARNMLEDINNQRGGVGDVLKNTDALLVKSQNTIDNLDNMLKSFNDVAQNTNSVVKKVDTLLGDKETIDDLKETVKNIRETAGEAKVLIKGINNKLGFETDETQKSEPIFSGKINSDNVYINKDKKFRSDLYADLFFRNNAVRLGVNDLGERNKGIIQYERKFGKNNIGKVGLFNSKLGLGYEYRYNRFSFAADWYNPNRSELFLRGKYKFTDNFGLFVGVDDIIQKNNRNFMIGLNIEK